MKRGLGEEGKYYVIVFVYVDYYIVVIYSCWQLFLQLSISKAEFNTILLINLTSTLPFSNFFSSIRFFIFFPNPFLNPLILHLHLPIQRASNLSFGAVSISRQRTIVQSMGLHPEAIMLVSVV